MRSAVAGFKLWHLMAVVAAVAVVLAMGLRIALGLGLLAWLGFGPGMVAWTSTRGRRDLAAASFAASSALAAVPLAVLCAYCVDLLGLLLAFCWAAVAVPTAFGFGVAWAVQVHRGGGPRWRTSAPAWLLVVASAALTASMIPTLWPLRLAFLASRPSLDALANRIASGETLDRPERAGLYLVVATRVEPASGSVALLIDDDSAFVRLVPAPTYNSPMVDLNLDMPLAGSWRYQYED